MTSFFKTLIAALALTLAAPASATDLSADEIKQLAGRIESLGSPQDRQGKHTLPYLKQMVKAKREKLATLRYNSER